MAWFQFYGDIIVMDIFSQIYASDQSKMEANVSYPRIPGQYILSVKLFIDLVERMLDIYSN